VRVHKFTRRRTVRIQGKQAGAAASACLRDPKVKLVSFRRLLRGRAQYLGAWFIGSGASKEVSNTEANVPHHLARNFSIFYVMTTKRLKLRLILMNQLERRSCLQRKGLTMTEHLWLRCVGFRNRPWGTAWTAKWQYFNPSQHLLGLGCQDNTESVRTSSVMCCRK
jgi:hypothetical protein